MGNKGSHLITKIVIGKIKVTSTRNQPSRIIENVPLNVEFWNEFIKEEKKYGYTLRFLTTYDYELGIQVMKSFTTNAWGSKRTYTSLLGTQHTSIVYDSFDNRMTDALKVLKTL